jgi:hypothetical protein
MVAKLFCRCEVLGSGFFQPFHKISWLSLKKTRPPVQFSEQSISVPYNIEVPFQCAVCNKTFQTKSDMQVHERSQHKPSL